MAKVIQVEKAQKSPGKCGTALAAGLVWYRWADVLEARSEKTDYRIKSRGRSARLLVADADSGFSEWEELGTGGSVSDLKRQAQVHHDSWVRSLLTPRARRILEGSPYTRSSCNC